MLHKRKRQYSDIIEIIREQGLDCHYCKDQTRIIPNSRKDQYQFTLDRKDNNKSHFFGKLVFHP